MALIASAILAIGGTAYGASEQKKLAKTGLKAQEKYQYTSRLRSNGLIELGILAALGLAVTFAAVKIIQKTRS